MAKRIRLFGKISPVLGLLAFLLVTFSTPDSARAELPALKVNTASLVSPASADTYYGAGTTSTVDLWSSGRPDEIKELARALRYDADLIYEYVRNNVETIAIYGLQKGALGAIYDQSGTPFDQAHLMVELLKEADAAGGKSYSPKYKAGTVTLTVSQVGNWLGLADAAGAVNTTAVQTLLADGGIPASISGSNVTLSHIWVEVTIGGSTYVFDPSYKTHTYKDGIVANLATITAYNETNLTNKVTTGSQYGATYASAVNKTALETVLAGYASALLTNLKTTDPNAEIEDVVGGMEIDLQSIPSGGLRQSALPYNPVVQHTWTGGIPNQYRTTLQVQLKVSSTTYIDATLYVDEFFGKRTRFVTVGGGIFFYVGTQQYQFNSPFPSSSDPDMVLTVNHPYAAGPSAVDGTYMDETISKGMVATTVITGNPVVIDQNDFVLVHGWGDSGSSLLKRFERETREDNIFGSGIFPDDDWTGEGTATPNQWTSNIVSLQHLSPIAEAWRSEFNSVKNLVGRVTGSVIQHHHSLGYVLGHLRSSGILADFDVDSAVSVTHRTGNATDRKAAIHTLAAASAAGEGGAIQRTYEIVDAASGVSLFDYSNQEASKFFLADSTTYTDEPSALRAAMAAKGWRTDAQNSVQAYVDAGYKVLVPEDGDIGGFYGGNIIWESPPMLAFKSTADRVSYLVVQPVASSPGQKGSSAQGGAAFGLLGSTLQTLENIEEEPDAYQYFNVNLADGSLNLTPRPDISVGSGDFPYKLEVSRVYDSNGLSDGALGVGWSHNFELTATIASNPYQGFGQDSGLEATETIAGLYAIFRLAQQSQTAARLTAAIFVANWWKETLVNNIINVALPGTSLTFTRLADGTYNPPRGSQDTLDITLNHSESPYFFKHMFFDSTATLSRGDGSSITFANVTPEYQEFADRSRVLYVHNWNMPSGMSVIFTYDKTTNGNVLPDYARLQSVSNNVGRALNFTYWTNSLGAVKLDTIADNESVATAVYGVGGVSIWLLGFGDDGSGLPGGGVPIYSRTYGLAGVTRPEGIIDHYGNRGWNDVFAPLGLPTGFTSLGSPIVEKMWLTPSVITDPGFLEFSYDSLRRIKTIKNASANVTNYHIGAFADENVRRSDIVDALGSATTTYFDRFSRPVEVIDPLGRSSTSEYDIHGRLTREISPEENVIEYSYGVRHNRTETRVKAKPGSDGLADIVTSATYAASCTGANQAFCNQPATETDSNGNVTTYAYFTLGLADSITGPAVAGESPLSSFTYNGFGQPLTQTVKISATENTVTAFTYDTLANHSVLKTVVTDSGGLGLTSTLSYDAVGNVTQIDGPRGTPVDDVTDITYDLYRRITQINRPEGVQSTITWNTDNTLQKTEHWDGAASVWRATLYDYTPTLRRNKVTDPAGDFTTLAYDAVGRLLVTADPEGRKTKNIYDAAGQLTKVIRAYQGNTDNCTDGTALQQCDAQYTYSDNGRQTTVTDANGNKTTFEYDDHDRLSRTLFASLTSGSGTSNGSDFEELTYDANGNIKTKRTRAEDIIANDYDALNRVILKDPQTSSLDPLTSLPRPDAPTVTYSYDLAGQQTSVSDGTVSLDFVFDKAGRNMQVTRVEGTDTKVISYQYDAASNRTRLTWPDGFFIAYDYDDLSRVTTVKEDVSATLLATYAHDTLSRRTALTLGNGRSVTFTYEDDSDLSRLEHKLASTVTYSYDFAYNKAGQQTAKTVSDSDLAWQPDFSKTASYTANGLNQYSAAGGRTYSYDDNGSLWSDGINTYSYDTENRLVSATTTFPTSNTVTYTYDPTGPRRSKTVNGTATTKYLSDGVEEIAEYNGAGTTILRRYVHGAGIDQPIVMYPGSGTSGKQYYLTDRIGTVVAMADSGGAIAAQDQYRYSPYGEVVSGEHSGNPFRFTGRRLDFESGLYYYRARYYDPRIGRFLQTDPIGFGDGLNLYAYVGNDPANNVDPTGTSSSPYGWLVRLSKGGLEKIKPLFDKKAAIRARDQGREVLVKKGRQSGRSVEAASAGNSRDAIRHSGHKLRDGSGATGRPHFQTKGKGGHTFYEAGGSVIAALIVVLEVLEELDPLFISPVACGEIDCNGDGIPDYDQFQPEEGTSDATASQGGGAASSKKKNSQKQDHGSGINGGSTGGLCETSLPGGGAVGTGFVKQICY